MSRFVTGPNDQQGQILPLFAISLVAILALVGLGLDGARVMLERRVAQGAADLAALSGARLLPDQVAARTTALQIAGANGYPSQQVTVTFPAATRIRVEVASNVQMLFSPVIGISDTPVGAGAAAIHEEEVVGGASVPFTGPAILGYANLCGGSGANDVIHWSGQDATVNGDVVTNSGADLPGGNNQLLGNETYLSTAGCTNLVTPHANPNPPVDFVAVSDSFDFPLSPSLAVLADPFSSGGICDKSTPSAYTRYWMTTDEIKAPTYATGSQIKDGVYCRVTSATLPTALDSKINIKTADFWCDYCTFVTEQFQASGARIRLESPAVAITADGTMCDMPDNTCGGYPLLTYATGTGDAINYSGVDAQWNGVWLTPNGDAHVSGGDSGIRDGAVWAYTVEISGVGFTLNGPSGWTVFDAAGPASPEVLALVE